MASGYNIGIVKDNTEAYLGLSGDGVGYIVQHGDDGLPERESSKSVRS